MSNRRRTRLTHEGWYYLFVIAFIVVGAIWQQVNLMIVLAGLMVAPLLLSWRVATATMRRLRVRRHLPQCVHAGQPFHVEITVRNLRGRLSSWFVVVEDRLRRADGEAGLSSADVEVLLPRVVAGGATRGRYRCLLPQRGEYQFGPLTISTRFPLGLLHCFRRVDSRRTVVALPRIGRLSKSWYELIHSRQAGVRRSRHRRALSYGGDFYGVRDWQPGDSRRFIHWRMTAKLGELAVRQFEQLDNLDVTLVLDPWQSDRQDEGQSHAVESAISCLATAVTEICRQSGTGLRVVLLGATMRRIRGPASASLGRQTLHDLALLTSSDDYICADRLLDVAGSVDPAEQIVVISTRPAEGAGVAADAADEPIRLLARRIKWLEVGSRLGEQCFVPPPPDDPLQQMAADESAGRRQGQPKKKRRAGGSVE